MKIIDRIKEKWRLKYLISIIIIGKGINRHEQIEIKENQKTIEILDITYNLNFRNVFVNDRSFFARIRDKIKRIKPIFSLFYIEGVKDPITLHDMPSPLLTSEVLDIAERSSALEKALSELFKGQISGRLVIFIVIIGIVGVLIYLVMTGGIQIPEGLLP